MYPILMRLADRGLLETAWATETDCNDIHRAGAIPDLRHCPVIVVGVARSIGAAVQSIVAGFVFGGVVRTVGRVVNSGVAAVGTVDIDRKTDS